MKLYKNSNGVWAGTQADARKMCGKDYSTVDVPVDKPNLLGFLNLNQVGSHTSNDKTETHYEVYIPNENKEDSLNKKAMSWFRWAHDCMLRGQYKDAEAMLYRGLKADKEGED
jgi:hypothetical protein